MRTLGVEEELLLVDERTGTPVAVAPTILASDTAPEGPVLEAEIQQEMLEVIGPPSSRLDEIADGIAEGRRRAEAAAHEVGAHAAAIATSPLPVTPHPSPTPRYREMMRRYGATAKSTLTCGFHVHVSVESPEEGVGVLDRIREWMPTLLALTGNSPFWNGADTGYSSYRNDVWSRWPCAGPNPVFGSEEGYRRHERMLLTTGTLLDPGMLYFDARLSHHHPTVEIRVADVCLREDDAVTVAGLARGLVERAAMDWRRGRPPIGADQRLLRLATWRAALTGVRGDHVDPATGCPRTPQEAVDALLDHVAPGLDVTDDVDRVERGLRDILRRGTGADWQREQFDRRGRMDDVVHAARHLQTAELAG